MHKRTLFGNSPAELSISSEEPLSELEIHRERDFTGRSETSESDNLISFNTDDHLSEGALYSFIDSKTRCDSVLNNVVTAGEQLLQDRDFLPIVEPVETIQRGSGTEVVYSEILDVTVRNQVASNYRSQEIQPLGLPTSHNCDNGVFS